MLDAVLWYIIFKKSPNRVRTGICVSVAGVGQLFSRMRIGNLNISQFVLILCVCIVSATLIQCAQHSQSAVNPPRDILGISIGMSKEDAMRRLEEIAVFDREERKRQQVWRMKDDSRFGHIAVGYDENDRIRYVTAIVDKSKAKERIRYKDVGDLSTAKKEIVEPHRRYIWDVPATDEKPAYSIIINGDEPEFVSIYSLSKIIAPKEKQE